MTPRRRAEALSILTPPQTRLPQKFVAHADKIWMRGLSLWEEYGCQKFRLKATGIQIFPALMRCVRCALR